MSEERSAAEIKADYVQDMGVPLGAVFHELTSQCVLLHIKWSVYVTLYGTKRERVELLNRVAPVCFGIIQECLWDELLLHLCRIAADPAVSFGKNNLSVAQLASLADPSVQAKLSNPIAELKKAVKPLKDHRNSRISHSDLDHSLRQIATPLPEVSRRSIRNALTALVAVLNTVEAHYGRPEVMYDTGGDSDDSEALLFLLRDGLNARWDPSAGDLVKPPDI